MSEAPRSVADAIDQLERDGYTGSFVLRDEGLRCTVCGEEHAAEAALVDRVYRFEGPSDPDEEAIVYGLRCPVCGAKGTLASVFGPGADPALADHLVMLEQRFRS